MLGFRNDGTGGYGLQGRSYNGLPSLVPGQRQRPVRRLYENSADESREKRYCVCGMAGKIMLTCGHA